MPQPSFSEIASLPDFQSLPFEKKAEVTKKYWQTSAAEDPQPAPEAPKSDLLLEPGQEQAVAPPSYHQEQYQDSLKYLDAQEKLKNATPIQARFLNQQLEDSAAALAVRESLKSGAMTEDEAAAFAEENVKARAGETEALAKTRRLFDPKLKTTVDNMTEGLADEARQGAVFGDAPPGSFLDLNNTLDKIITPAVGDEGPVLAGKRNYETGRNIFAKEFGLSAEEADDYIKHKAGLQQEGVSQDVFGQIHIKDETLAKPVEEVRKEIEGSNLPADLKEKYTAKDSPELELRLGKFKADTVENTIKNHPELASSLGLSGDEKKLDQDFGKITGALNKSWTEQLLSGAGAGALRDAADIGNITGGQLTTASGIPYNPTGHTPDEVRAMTASAQKRQESINQLSSQLNESKTKILGADAASVGSGLYSAAQSALITTATGPLAGELVPMRFLPTIGKAVKAAAAVQPVTALSATRQASDTYKDALAAGKTPEEASDYAKKAFLFEWGFTTLFSAGGAGGLESIGTNVEKDAIKRTLAGSAWHIVKNVAEELPEEELINLFQTVAVDAKLNPHLTEADLRKRAWDTFVATAGSTGAISGGAEIVHQITTPATPTHEQNTDALHDEADALYTKAALNAEKDLSETKDEGGAVTPPGDAGVVKPQMTTAEVLASAKENAATEVDPEHKTLLESGDAAKIAESYGVEINDEQDQKEKPEEASLPLREVPTGTETSTNTESAGSNEEVAGPAKAEGEVEVKPTVTISEPNAQGLVRAKTDNVEADFKPTDDPKTVELDLIRRKDRKSAADQGTRKGEGQEVLKAAEEHFAAQGVEKIVARADNNPDLLAWYERNGYTRGTTNKSDNTVNVSKDLTAPVVSPATETATATAPALTQEATDLLTKVDGGAVPLGITPNFERIATENGIEVTGSTTPQQVIDQLREKQATAPVAPAPTTATETAPTPAPTASEAVPAPTPTAAPTLAAEAPTPPQRKLPPRPVKPKTPEETSLQRAAMDDDFKRFGMPPLERPLKESDEENFAKAQEILKANPRAGTELIERATKDPSQVRTTADFMVLLHETAQRKLAVAKAIETVNTAAPENLVDAQFDLNLAETAYNLAAQVSQSVGTNSARLLRARRLIISKDFSLENMRSIYRAKINYGTPLNAQQSKDLAEISKKWESADKVIKGLEEENAKLQLELDEKAHIEYREKSAAANKEHGLTSREAKRASVKARLERAQKRLAAKKGNLNAGLDPTTLADTVAVVYNYLELGLRSLPEIKAKIVETYGKWIDKHVDKAFEQATALFNESAAEPETSKEATPKSVYEAADKLIKSGIKGTEVLDKVQEQYPDKTREEIRDLFLNKSKESNRTLSELEQERNRIKRLESLDSDIEKLKKGVVKTPRAQAIKNSEVAAKEQERNRLRKELTKDTTRIKSLDKQIAEIEARIKNKDFVKEPKLPKKESNVVLDAIAKRTKAEIEFNKLLLDDKIKQQSFVVKTAKVLVAPLSAARTIKTTLDTVPLFRQGLPVLLAQPKIALKSAGVGIKAQFSQTVSDREQARIKSHPDYDSAVSGGLSLTEEGPTVKSSQREEGYDAQFLKNVPLAGRVIKGAERNYVTFSNANRMDMYSLLKNQLLEKAESIDPKVNKMLCSFVNTCTGRGNLGRLEGAADWLALPFFSPRFWASRLNLIYGITKSFADFSTGFQLGDKETRDIRKLIARQHGRMALGYGVVFGLLYALGQGLDDKDDYLAFNLNPISPDFLKFKVGRTRFDTTGGVSSHLVFLSRMVMGRQAFAANQGEKELRSFQDYAGVAANYVRGRLAPVPGAVISAKTGKDPIGKVATWRSELIGMYLPMSPNDLYEQWGEFGPAGTIAAAGFTVMGAGGSVYDDDLSVQQKWAIKLGDEPADFVAKKSKAKGGGGAYKVRVRR